MTENDLDRFRETRTRMSAAAFGQLVRDAQWEEDTETEFLVYEDSWWIEALQDGRYMLTLENHGWITGEETSLEDLEERLHAFARDQANSIEP